jgi:hypothetical protein
MDKQKLDNQTKKQLADIFGWICYEFDIPEKYENGESDMTVENLKNSHRIADNKLAELYKLLGVSSQSELQELRK